MITIMYIRLVTKRLFLLVVIKHVECETLKLDAPTWNAIFNEPILSAKTKPEKF